MKLLLPISISDFRRQLTIQEFHIPSVDVRMALDGDWLVVWLREDFVTSSILADGCSFFFD